ncbi:hypothetical protein HPULCUR_004766 [Helicostylum pulchrum]|uniref:Uncharacterized protein n=1 Tax=Helicostylum pulchrum TaxID=562976 RepID=A0ABP9XX61_9FUNG
MQVISCKTGVKETSIISAVAKRTLQLQELFNFTAFVSVVLCEQEKRWIKSAVINYSLLFVNSPKISDYGNERDLFEEVYKFIRQSQHINFTEPQS